jgi:hypothetical protein
MVTKCALQACVAIFQVLLNNDFPFKLGPKVFGLLLDVFLFRNFSVLSFIRSYQVRCYRFLA